MNILSVCYEDIGWVGTISLSTAAGYFNSYNRCAIAAYTGANTSIISAVSYASQTSVWLAARARLANVYGTLKTGTRLFGLTNSNGNGIYIGSAASNKFSLVKYDGSTETVLATQSGSSLNITALMKIVMQISDYGASGNVKVWVDDALIIDYTGNISISGVAGFTNVSNFSWNASSTSIATYLSEVIVADEDPSALIGVVRYPIDTDESSDVSGTHADIDEITTSYADTVYTDTVDEDGIFGLSGLPEGNYAVAALSIQAKAIASTGSTANKLKLGADVGGSVDVDSGHGLTTAWATYERIAYTLNGSQIDPANTLKLAIRSDEIT